MSCDLTEAEYIFSCYLGQVEKIEDASPFPVNLMALLVFVRVFRIPTVG